jgi:hypothetical protein
VIVGLAIVGCSEIGRRPVVQVGTTKFTLDDLRHIYADLPTNARPALSTRPQRLAFADEVVRRHLLAEHGRSIAEGDTARQAAARVREDVLLRRLHAIEGGMGDPTPEELRASANQIATRYSVRRFVFVERAAAERAAERLAQGAPAESIAADPQCRAFGPETLVWVPWPIDPLADAVTRLSPGQSTGPIEGDGLPQIVQLLEVTAVPSGTGLPADSRLTELVRRRKRGLATEALAEQLRNAASIRFDEETMRLLAERTRSAILSGEVAENDLDFAIPALSPEEEARTAATYRSVAGVEERFTAGDYLRELRRTSAARRPWRGPLRLLAERSMTREIERRLLVQEAERRRIDQDWWAERDLRLIEEERVLRRGRRDIEAAVTITDASIDSMTSFLVSAQPGVLSRPSQAHVLRMDFPTEEAAADERARALAAGGLNARVADILEGRALSGGVVHVFRISPGALGSPEIDRLVFDGAPGRTQGPVRFGASWILLEVQGFESAGARSPEDLRDEVRRSLHEGRSASVIETWVRARRDSLGVAIDEEQLDRLSHGV